MLGAVVLGVGALAVTGCGGDDEVSASTRWAGDLCTAVDTWRTSMTSTANELSGNPTREGLENAADDVKGATQTLVDTVQGLGNPDTESGEQAQEAIEALSTSIESDLETITEAVDGVTDVRSALQAATTVSATVSKITSDISDSLNDIEALGEVDDELQDSFAEAESCDGVIPPD
jgi:methyl-accepting chemotaxis protein